MSEFMTDNPPSNGQGRPTPPDAGPSVASVTELLPDSTQASGPAPATSGPHPQVTSAPPAAATTPAVTQPGLDGRPAQVAGRGEPGTSRHAAASTIRPPVPAGPAARPEPGGRPSETRSEAGGPAQARPEAGRPTEAARQVPVKGRIHIADEVVEKVAALAALEVRGVADLGGDVERAIESVRERIGIGSKRGDQGVKADINGQDVRVSVTVMVEYGHVVLDVARHVQANVAEKTQRMLGLNVVEVNVTVDDVRTGEEPSRTSPR